MQFGEGIGDAAQTHPGAQSFVRAASRAELVTAEKARTVLQLSVAVLTCLETVKITV